MKNRRKSLSEAMGYKKRPRKMTLNELRSLIETQLLFEEEEQNFRKRDTRMYLIKGVCDPKLTGCGP